MAFLNFLKARTLLPRILYQPANSIYQTIVLPLLLAGILYALLTFAILPFYRRHRQRYAQYLPLNTLSNTTTRTSSFLRDRILSRIFLPSAWAFRSGRRRTAHAVDGAEDEDDDNSLFGSEEGEGMVGFDVDGRNQNFHPAGVRGGGDGGGGGGGGGGTRPVNDRVDSDRRLSRELEEGFRDDSEEEDDSVPNERRPEIAR